MSLTLVGSLEEEEDDEILVSTNLFMTPTVSEDDPLQEKRTELIKVAQNLSVPLPLPKLQSYSCEAEWVDEMEKCIGEVIFESVNLFQKDPREYHPFYLRVYKYILLGQKCGFLRDCGEIWLKYDKLAEKRPLAPTPANWEPSAYAVFIQKRRVYVNGKVVKCPRNEKERLCRFKELEKVAKGIWEKWSEGGGGGMMDLQLRLEFFEECKTMTFPADVIKMNNLWAKLLNGGFKGGRGGGRKVEFKSNEEIKDSNTHVIIENVPSYPEPHSNSPFLCEEGPVAMEEVDLEVDSTLIPKTMSSEAVSNDMKPQKRTSLRRKSKMESGKLLQQLKLVQKLRKKRRKLEEANSEKLKRRRERIFRKNWEVIKASWIKRNRRRLAYQKQIERCSEKIQITVEKIITGTCPPKSLQRQKIIRPGPKTKLEPIPKSRKRRGSVKKSNANKKTEDIPCKFCDEGRFSSLMKEYKHVETVHPEMLPRLKELRRERYRLKARERFQQARETGEGPKWLLNRLNSGDWGHSSKRERKDDVICEVCGGIYAAACINTHKMMRHNPDRPLSRCPGCPEIFKSSQLLWHHFLRDHLGHDLMLLARQKGEGLGFRYNKMGMDKPKTEEPTEHVCDLCGQSFWEMTSLKRHQFNVHGDGVAETWKCDLCEKTFKQKDNRDAHVRQVHEGLDYRCDLCNRKMQSKGKLWRHKVEHHKLSDLAPPEGLVVLQCPFCEATMLRGMDVHQKKMHLDRWAEYVEWKKNDKKERGKSEQQRLKNIMRKREMRKKWREEGIAKEKWIQKRPPKNCPHCGIVVTKKMVWVEHLFEVHGIDVTDGQGRKWVCPWDGCDRMFWEPAPLKYHIIDGHCTLDRRLMEEGLVDALKNPDGFWEFHCRACGGGDKLNSMEAVMIHFLLCHPTIYQKHKSQLDPEAESGAVEIMRMKIIGKSDNIQCPHCHVEFERIQNLRTHLDQVHPDQCWRCPEDGCEMVIISPQELQQHFSMCHNPGEEEKKLGQSEKHKYRPKSDRFKKCNSKMKTPSTTNPSTKVGKKKEAVGQDDAMTPKLAIEAKKTENFASGERKSSRTRKKHNYRELNGDTEDDW